MRKINMHQRSADFSVFSIMCFVFVGIPCCAQSGLPAMKLKMQQVAEGLTSPVGLMNAGDGSARIFVIEQSGKIKIIKNGTVLPTPFLTITNKLDGLNIAYSEKGL